MAETRRLEHINDGFQKLVSTVVHHHNVCAQNQREVAVLPRIVL